MMGHRDKLIDGDEWDALTRGGRRVHSFRPGVRKQVKRKVNRRARRDQRTMLSTSAASFSNASSFSLK